MLIGVWEQQRSPQACKIWVTDRINDTPAPRPGLATLLASVPRLTREAAEVTAEAAASATSDVESQGPSLPLSILDVRSKALDEIQNKQRSRAEQNLRNPVRPVNLCPISLIRDHFLAFQPK